MFPVLFSPNETVYFLGFFTSWIRIRSQEAYLYPDPKHCLKVLFFFPQEGFGYRLQLIS